MSDDQHPLAFLLGQMNHTEPPELKLNILPEVAVERLREAMTRYGEGCAFIVGDMVTPRRDAPHTRVGEPHIVLEVFRVPRQWEMTGGINSGSNRYGEKLDIRIAHIVPTDDREFMAAYWVESWLFEPWPAP